MTKAELLALSHRQAHDAEHNPEDTLMVQLTRRELWLIFYGLLCGEINSPCLLENSLDLQQKFAEIMEVQGYVRGEETP